MKRIMKRIVFGVGGTIVALAMAAALQGCGGGGGGSSSGGGGSSSGGTATGYFVDAPVSGAIYTTSSGLTGTTASDGSFTYRAGDKVTFTVLGVPLGSPAAVPSNGVVTPVTITGEASSGTTVSATNAPNATAIAQFLQTLGRVGASSSSTSSGSIVLPNGTAASTLQQLLASLNASGGIPAVVNGLQTALSSAGITGVAVVPTSTAVAAMNTSIQAAASAAANSQYVNSTWTITANSPGSGGATIELLGNGTVAGMTQSGNVIYGTWVVNSDGSIAFNLATQKDGTGTGTMPANQTSCPACMTVTNSTGSTFTAAMTESSSGTQNQYAGIWFATYTPNSTGAAAGETGGSAAMIAESNGSIVGMVITNGEESFIGNWTASSGAVTFTGTGGTNSPPWTVSGSFATQTGTLSKNGTMMGTIAFARTAPAGMFGGSSVTATATQFPSCPSSTTASVAGNGVGVFTTAGTNTSLLAQSTCDLPFVVSQNGASVILAGGSCTNTFNGPIVGTWSGCLNGTTLTASQNYVLGSTTGSATMTCTAGSGGLSNCNISSGSTVPVPNGSGGYVATPFTGTGNIFVGTFTPLNLNVQINWPTNVGNVTSSIALSLTVLDSTGSPVANTVKSEVNSLGVGAQAWQMTDNIAVSYPSSGVTYQLSVGPANCAIFNGSGNVCTSNCAGASYPTVTITCQ